MVHFLMILARLGEAQLATDEPRSKQMEYFLWERDCLEVQSISCLGGRWADLFEVRAVVRLDLC